VLDLRCGRVEPPRGSVDGMKGMVESSRIDPKSSSFCVNGRRYALPPVPLVVICVDGCGDEYLSTSLAHGRMPNLARMILQGYRGLVRGALPSFTNVNNASIVTGVPPSVTGIAGNYFIDRESGQQQAKLYADCLESMHGQRPIIFYTNGYKTHLWDDLAYPPRTVAGFYKKDELASLILRRAQREPLDAARVKDAIVERYYQKRAIGSIAEQFTQARRKALLVMATGSGKTRTAIALVDLLQRAGCGSGCGNRRPVSRRCRSSVVRRNLVPVEPPAASR